MRFMVFRCMKDPDFFVVTDEEHAGSLAGTMCPRGGDLQELGVFDEMGEDRVAFDETLARNSIAHQGYYRFEARSFDPVAQPPGVMPG